MKTSCCQTQKLRKNDGLLICDNHECDNYLRPTQEFIGPKTWNNIFAAFFFIFFFILSFDDFSYDSNGLKWQNFSDAQTTVTPLTKENLRKEINAAGIICSDQVYAQILIESGHLNSFLSKRINNLLGMRFPFRRNTTAVGLYLPESDTIVYGTQDELKKYRSKNNYAVYANWQECVQDYKLWQTESFKLNEKYLKFLGTYYAEDTLYIQKIRRMMN